MSTSSDALAGEYWIKGVWGAGNTDANAVVNAHTTNATLSLTDSQGDCWAALIHGDTDGDGVKDQDETWTYTAAAATPNNKKYGRLTLDFHVYSDENCTNEVTGASNLKAVDGTYTFYITSTQNRLRFSKVDAAGSYAATYGTDITVTVTISAGVISDNLSELFYSFGGGVASNVDLAEGDAINDSEVDSQAPSGTIQCALAAN